MTTTMVVGILAWMAIHGPLDDCVVVYWGQGDYRVHSQGEIYYA